MLSGEYRGADMFCCSIISACWLSELENSFDFKYGRIDGEQIFLCEDVGCEVWKLDEGSHDDNGHDPDS